MANLDVSDLLSDEDFGDPFTLVRRTSVVNGHGENVLSGSAEPAFGSIQPAGGLLRQLVPDAARPQDWIKVYAPVMLRAASVTDPSGYADIVEFNGIRYVVHHVDSWMHFGAGYCRALCQSEESQG